MHTWAATFPERSGLGPRFRGTALRAPEPRAREGPSSAADDLGDQDCGRGEDGEAVLDVARWVMVYSLIRLETVGDLVYGESLGGVVTRR